MIASLTIPEGSAVKVLRRMTTSAEVLLTLALTTSITRRITNRTTDAVIESGTALTLGTVVYDTAQTGEGWPFGLGWNFRDVIPGSLFSTVGLHQVTYTIIGLDGVHSVKAHAVTVTEVY